VSRILAERQRAGASHQGLLYRGSHFHFRAILFTTYGKKKKNQIKYVRKRGGRETKEEDRKKKSQLLILESLNEWRVESCDETEGGVASFLSRAMSTSLCAAAYTGRKRVVIFTAIVVHTAQSVDVSQLSLMTLIDELPLLG
jgi:hypothetical protein